MVGGSVSQIVGDWHVFRLGEGSEGLGERVDAEEVDPFAADDERGLAFAFEPPVVQMEHMNLGSGDTVDSTPQEQARQIIPVIII